MDPAWATKELDLDDADDTTCVSGVRPSSIYDTPDMRDEAPTAVSALYVEEEERTRGFLRIAVAYALIVAVASNFVDVSLGHRLVLFGGIVVGASACVWLIAAMRWPGGYTPQRAFAAGLCCLFAALTGVFFFGAFSPAAVVLPFGLYYFSLGRHESAISWLSALGGIGFAAVCTGELMGITSGGVVVAESVSIGNKVMMLVMVEVTLAATCLAARASRRASIKAVATQLELATNIAQREALLLEARRDLQHALESSGVGRYTDEVLGSFRLGAVIGRGAMGEVYEAKRLSDGVPAAVKLLKPEVLRDANVVRRFIREAKMTASLDIPFVARVIEISDQDSRAPYIAMELLRGQSLADILETRRLTVAEVSQLLREVGCALDAAHACGVVHRDIKPTNVFLDRKGLTPTWKVLDFGVAKLISTSGTLTEGLIVGTPAYMAPEQAGGRGTASSDLFGLGVIAYRALTGRMPFQGKGWADTIYNIATSMPMRASDIAPVNEDVDAVLAIAMAKNPDDRFRSGHCFAKAFGAALRCGLDDHTVDKAWRVMRKHPWGSTADSIPPSSVG